MGFFSDSTNENLAALAARIGKVERKLDAIMKHMQVECHEDGFEDIRELIAEGETILAIKAYRKRTGAGLAEAKSAIERGV